jgi:hypothetical protein
VVTFQLENYFQSIQEAKNWQKTMFIDGACSNKNLNIMDLLVRVMF